MKILVIQQKMIGDVLTSTVLFKLLRNKYPAAQLDYLINTHTKPVVIGNPYVDSVVEYTPEIEENTLNLKALIKRIRATKYDVVIDVYGKLSSHLITKFSGATVRIGYRKKTSAFFFSHSIKRTKKPTQTVSLAIENRLKLLKPLGIPFEAVAPDIFLLNSEKEKAATFLLDNNIDITKKLYMISVLGSNSSKTYPPKYMAQILDAIVSHNPEVQLLFNYIPNQKKVAKAIYNATKTKTQTRIFFDVYGDSLRAFLAITSHCDAMIGNEGGAVNMAKALNVPSFVIFSPYLNKINWFGSSEAPPHLAVHLSDFITHTEAAIKQAKKDPESYYLKFKPTFIIPKLISFINSI